MSDTDLQLLARYTRNRAEDAFAEIVRRHVDLVYSSALRQVRSPQLAEEVAQSVFTDLAREATRLKHDTILSAWLYQVTRRTAIDVVRHEARRQLREQIATEMNAMNATASDWMQVEPLLDEAMSALDETDRAAVLLRYFENKSFRDVGQQLGVSDDAAQKRVSRAVERLREFFSKRGVPVGASGLVVVISANAVQAAPGGLAATISTVAALTATTMATGAGAKIITMTTLQKAAVSAAITVAVGAGLYEIGHASRLRAEVQTAQQQQATLSDELQTLQGDYRNVSARLVGLQTENNQLQGEHSELLRLRSETERFRTLSQELAALKANDEQGEDGSLRRELREWVVRVNQLKKYAAETPELSMPEFKLLTEESWFNAAADKLRTEEAYRRGMASLRSSAGAGYGKRIQQALRKYIRATKGQFPTEVSQLKSYFDPPIEETVLQRYKIVPAKGYTFLDDRGDWVIVSKEPLDKKYDLRTCVAANDYTSGAQFPKGMSDNRATTGLNNAIQILKPAIDSFTQANYGLLPYDHMSELAPYVTTDEQRAALEQLLEDR